MEPGLSSRCKQPAIAWTSAPNGGILRAGTARRKAPGEQVPSAVVNLDPLKKALRAATPPPARKAGERWAAGGKVGLSEEDEGGILLVIDGAGRNEVWLWPGDAEWECDCEAPADGCAHAWAALLALASGSLGQASEPPALVFELASSGNRIRAKVLVRVDGVEGPFAGGVRGLELDSTVIQLMRLGQQWLGGQVPPAQNGILLAAVVTADEVRLDGRIVVPSRIPLDRIALVETIGRGYRLSLVDPPEVLAAFPGDPSLVATQDGLRPRGSGRLDRTQIHQLRNPLIFAAHELPRLTAEWLPALEKSVQVVRRDGVPEAKHGGLELLLLLEERPGLLEVTPRLVYGDPPVAEVRDGQLLPLGGVAALPPRDRKREQKLIEQLSRQLNLRVGQRVRLDGPDAARFVRTRLPGFTGTVVGDASGFAPRPPLTPSVAWKGGRLQVGFRNEAGALVGAGRVLDAFRRGESAVSLGGGGYADLPMGWLKEHHDSVALAVESDAASGRHLAPLAADLLSATGTAPPPDLTQLVDALRDGGDIPVLSPPDELQAELRPYQQRGYEWLRFLASQKLGGVLADDMGLGKTVQALAAILARKTLGPTLVVAPRSVLRNWQDEATKFAPSLRVAILHGARKRTYDRLEKGELDVVITTWGTLRNDIDRLIAARFATAVLDEAQAIKNPDSLTAQAARRLNAGWTVALTGTPLENHLSELWSLMDCVNPGFFGPRKRFEERLGRPATDGDPRAMAAIRGRVRPFILRRLKSEVATDLPPRTDSVLRCGLSDAQRAAYESVRRGALADTQSDKPGGRRFQILAALTRLRQACCDAALLPGGDPDAPSAKLDLLDDLLEELVDEGHRILVFSQWTSLLDRVEPRLDKAGLDRVRLDGSTRDRAGAVARFQAPDGPPIFLISLKAGGTGLNLTAADHVVHLDPWWNPAAEQQATDRAHRIGQERPVFVWKLVAEGTVEEEILKLQERKKALADAVLEGGDGPGRLGEDDLIALLQAPLV
jgi:superfamily II DNA or RNA helicase